jgi:hypothetical protein
VIFRHSTSIAAALAAVLLSTVAAAQPTKAPASATRGFDQPKPSLTLNPPQRDAVAGLAPGQDLIGKAPLNLQLSAADLDSYVNSQEYRQKLSQYFPRRPLGSGKEAAGLGIAGAAALALKAEDALADRMQEDIKDRIEAGDLPPMAGYGLDVARLAASVAIATAAVRPK